MKYFLLALAIVFNLSGCSNDVDHEQVKNCNCSFSGDAILGDDPGPFLYVVLLGDVGTGEAGQYKVANAIAGKCNIDICDFGLLLGDNFYPDGVRSIDDAQWQSKFELPYANIRFEFKVVLGNHDVSANSSDSQFQINYSALSTKWSLPAEYYSFVEKLRGLLVCTQLQYLQVLLIKILLRDLF
jgi:hypothetical protein